MRSAITSSCAGILLGAGLILSGCAKQNAQDAAATATATPAPAASVTDSPAAAAAVTASADAGSPSPASSSAALSSVAFTDIAGLDGETAIKQLAALGVFGATSGQFHPHDPLRRALYVEWLVKANNAYTAATNNPALRIRLAEPGATATFADVKPSLAEFPYIQGMADAGLLVGYDGTHFKPEKLLSREEMLAILITRNLNGHAPADYHSVGDQTDYISDGAQLALVYRGLINEDHWNEGNIARIFGSIKQLHPKQIATREEAAVALQTFTGLFGRGTTLSASDALKK